MFDTVIIPLDGSPHAEVAVPFALDEALRHGATLILMHVIPRPEPCASAGRRSGPLPWQGGWTAQELEGEKRAAHDYLHDVAVRYRLRLQTVPRVAVGDPRIQIAAEANQHAAPLIVLTRKDPTPKEWAPRSYVADYLSEHGFPTLCVQQEQRNASLASGKVGNSVSTESRA